MTYTVAMVRLDQIEDPATQPLTGSFPTVDDANRAGDAEIERMNLPPGAITYKVFDGAGKEVDETGMGLS